MARQVPKGYFAFIGTALTALSFKNGIISRITVSNVSESSEITDWLKWVVLVVRRGCCLPHATTATSRNLVAVAEEHRFGVPVVVGFARIPGALHQDFWRYPLLHIKKNSA